VVSLEEAKQQIEDLKTQISSALPSFGRLESVLFRALSLTRRLGLPESMDRAIQKVERMIMAVQLLHTSLITIEASTPYGWIMALLSVSGVAITTAEMTHEFMGDVQGH